MIDMILMFAGIAGMGAIIVGLVVYVFTQIDI
jgi:hypothetical protein